MNKKHYIFRINSKKVGFMLVRTEPSEKGYKRSIITKFKVEDHIIDNPFHYFVDEKGQVTRISRDNRSYNGVPVNYRHGYPGCAYSEALKGLKLELGFKQSYLCLNEDSGKPLNEILLTVVKKIKYQNPVTGILSNLYKIDEGENKRFFLVDDNFLVHCANWGGTAESILVDSEKKMLEALDFAY